MNSDQISEIVAWIASHPEHVYECDGESFEDDSPAEAWARFCRDPTLVNEYDDPENHDMDRLQEPNGCTYIFQKGSCKGCRCNSVVEPGRTYCPFHDHPVFSAEVRASLSRSHAEINSQSTPPPQTVRLEVEQIETNLYCELTHGLALRPEGPSTIKCLGYFPVVYEMVEQPEERKGLIPAIRRKSLSAKDVIPLTPQLAAWCQQQGIICN